MLPRKRPCSSSVPAPTPPKITKQKTGSVQSNVTERMVSILAEAGCTVVNPSGPPCLPSDANKLRRHLTRIFSDNDNGPKLRSDFMADFSSYIQSPDNLRRVLTSSTCNGGGSARSVSLVRNLLLVPPIQLDLQSLLLERLPEYFDSVPETSATTVSLEDDIARLIVNHFRWLDFLVDANAFTERLMQVLSICPLPLKKEMVGSLPEIIGDHNHKALVDSLESMLQEDSAIIVPVLDSLSNLNLDDQLQQQVITIALSCIRTIDVEHMPYLLRFLMLSATPSNVRRIISQIREHLKLVGVSRNGATHNKLKGESSLDNMVVPMLDALRTSLRFKNLLCKEILKEVNCLDKPRDHKAIDIWLLMLIYMKGEPHCRTVEKIFKKKIVDGCIQEVILDQCICGKKELVQDYFPPFLSLAEFLLACKEQKARAFSTHLYTRLFEEFADAYSRQEILGALITHVGSGVNFEVSSALETMTLLSTKYPLELTQFASHINGMLDYLEGFSIENLHKVYEVFSHLALSAQRSADCLRSCFANELLIIIRKQVSHQDLKYKKMGLIGTLKIVSCLGGEPNCEEALELLKTCLDSCKQFSLPLILFYDELTEILGRKTLQPGIMDWIGKHVGEFESTFLSDLECGKLPNNNSYCGLEGELWMNLDGDISPICLNLLPLASTSLQSASSIQILPSIFVVLSHVERLTNQGSLAGIDALLGCPLHLPCSKYFLGVGWQSLTGKQKQIVCLCLYYAANWIRELLNAFSSQVTGRFECVSQFTKEDVITKLLKRLRNLVFLESLLNNLIEWCPLSLPQLHLYMEHSEYSILSRPTYMGHVEKRNDGKQTCDGTFAKKRKYKNISKASAISNSGGKVQPLTKAGVTKSQKEKTVDSSVLSVNDRTLESLDQHSCASNELVMVEIPKVSQALEVQRFKFRPLLVQCFSILTFSKNQNSCCSDLAAELPLFLYLLRELRYKLDCFAPSGKRLSPRCLTAPAGFGSMTADVFLSKIRPLFPSLRSLLNGSLCVLKEGDGTCQENWKLQSAAAGNPSLPNLLFSESSVSTLVFKEVLNCFSKMLNLAEFQMDKSVLSDLLEAFQPLKMSDSSFSGLQPIPSFGTTEYLYLGACCFLEDILNIACSFSFTLASESLITLESVVISFQKFHDEVMEANGKAMHSGHNLITILRSKLRSSAQRLLKNNWNNASLENGWKSKGEILQKILRIYLETSEFTSDLLDELACSILPQIPLSECRVEDNSHGFPSLCPATFVLWYRVLHEVNLTILNKLVKEVVSIEKRQAGVQPETIETHLLNIHKTVNVVVSLVNVCRTYDKVIVHAMAVKYGGKFVDSFLKVFDFLKTHFRSHNELVIQLVTELQKATRTIQTLCSEAKGSKLTAITCKIPATKRSLERFIFHVKALLHTTSSSCTFWMGNLKHKDLTGQVVSSQAYVDNYNDHIDEDPAEAVDENQCVTIASEHEKLD